MTGSIGDLIFTMSLDDETQVLLPFPLSYCSWAAFLSGKVVVGRVKGNSGEDGTYQYHILLSLFFEHNSTCLSLFLFCE